MISVNHVKEEMASKQCKESVLQDDLSYEHFKFIELRRPDRNIGFGFSACLTADNEIIVNRIDAGSVASRNGKLCLGDRILWIGNNNVESANNEVVTEMLHNANDYIRLVVSEKKHEVRLKASIPSGYEEVQLIPSLENTEEPYSFEVTYLHHPCAANDVMVQ